MRKRKSVIFADELEGRMILFSLSRSTTHRH
jgi:hypothetical protein